LVVRSREHKRNERADFSRARDDLAIVRVSLNERRAAGID
jgi:hypothetical protein